MRKKLRRKQNSDKQKMRGEEEEGRIESEEQQASLN